MKKYYLICPVRNMTTEEERFLEGWVAASELLGNKVHCPPRDVDQSDPTGLEICKAHLKAMEECDTVWVYWNPTSFGSHFDLGMAFALKKPVVLLNHQLIDTAGKSYYKVINNWPFNGEKKAEKCQ